VESRQRQAAAPTLGGFRAGGEPIACLGSCLHPGSPFWPRVKVPTPHAGEEVQKGP